MARLNVQLTAMAALGAEMKLRVAGAPGDPRTRPLLQSITDLLGPGLLDDMEDGEEEGALGLLQTFFRDASSLLDTPGAKPGWTHADPVILRSLGRSSRSNIFSILALLPGRPALEQAIAGGQRFLDIGTGVGQVAMTAARVWPHLQVVGIDLWEPSLAIARETLAASEVADRVELRHQDLADLDDREAYALAWLPAPFIPGEVVGGAMPRLWRAMAPGGWLVVGLFAIPPEPLPGAVARLRTVRGGGHPWVPDDMVQLMQQAGFVDVECPPPTGMVRVIGRRPVE